MDLINVIKGCTLIEEIEVLECIFDFDERQKEAAFNQRIVIWSNNLVRDLEIETRGIYPELFNGWSTEERDLFNADWNDDSFLAGLESVNPPLTPEVMPEWFNDWDDNSFLDDLSEIMPDAIQTGEGNRKRPATPTMEPTQSKKSKTVPLFTIKSVKQVKVKKFKTTGIDYKIQFNDLQVRGITDVLRYLHNVFASVLDRVTDGVAMHDQVRFIMHSPQLEYPISLPFMPREKLTVERILAEIERVIQSNDTFTLDDSITVNIIHVAMPYGGTGKKRKIANLDKYLNNKRAIVRIQNKDNLCLRSSYCRRESQSR